MKSVRKFIRPTKKDIGEVVLQNRNSSLDNRKINDLSPKKPFQCYMCSKSFFRKGNLDIHCQSHDSSKHTEYTPKEIGRERPHACNICNKIFTAKKNLLKHLRIVHKNLSEAEKLQIKKTRCPQNDCFFTCRKLKDLRGHIEKFHEITILKDCLQFSNEAVFQKWKKEEETNSVSCFVAYRRKSTLSDGSKKQILSCHRTGQYSPKGTGKYKLKSNGSCKIGSTCPAAMEITENPDGQMTVVYYKTHLGHSHDLFHLQLSKEERARLSERIEQGFSLDAILEDIRESIDPADGKIKRIHLLSRKDLYNIMRSFDSEKKLSRKNETVNTTDTNAGKIGPNYMTEVNEGGNCIKNSISFSGDVNSNQLLSKHTIQNYVVCSKEEPLVDNSEKIYESQRTYQYHRVSAEATPTISEENASPQVLIVSPEDYHSVTEVILVHPAESVPDLQASVYSSELITYHNSGSEKSTTGNPSIHGGQSYIIEEKNKKVVKELPADKNDRVKRINFTEQLKQKMEKVLSFLPKSEFLTPRQYELINTKLESIINIYDTLNTKSKSKKCARKVSNSKKVKMAHVSEEKEVMQKVTESDETVLPQPVYESPLYAYLCNYN